MGARAATAPQIRLRASRERDAAGEARSPSLPHSVHCTPAPPKSSPWSQQEACPALGAGRLRGGGEEVGWGGLRTMKGTVRKKSGGGHGGGARRWMRRKPSDGHVAPAARPASTLGRRERGALGPVGAGAGCKEKWKPTPLRHKGRLPASDLPLPSGGRGLRHPLPAACPPLAAVRQDQIRNKPMWVLDQPTPSHPTPQRR